MRQFLAIMMLLIFAFQVLPVKRISKLLNQGQNTEEVQGDDSMDDVAPDGKIMNCDHAQIMNHHSFEQDEADIAFCDKTAKFTDRSELLFSVHISGLLSPPPDC